jgi:hypothetical protein
VMRMDSSKQNDQHVRVRDIKSKRIVERLLSPGQMASKASTMSLSFGANVLVRIVLTNGLGSVF